MKIADYTTRVDHGTAGRMRPGPLAWHEGSEPMDTISHKPAQDMNMYSFDRIPIGTSGSEHSKPGQEAEHVGESESDDHDFGRYLEARLAAGTSSLYAEAMEWMERRLLVRVLSETSGNKSKACQILGITRGSLRHKIAQLGISIHQTVSVDDVSFI